MQCIGEGNDDNRNGVKDSEESSIKGSGNNNNNNREEKTYCDVPNPSNPCHDRRDVSETTGLATCLDGSHEEDWRDCNGNGDKEYPNCNDVGYGTRCDGSEDENSWTDEEVGGN